MNGENGLQENLNNDDVKTNEKIFLVAGWELDIDNLIIHIDGLHKELLQGLGYEHIPDSMTLLEYAEQYVVPDDLPLIQDRCQYAISRRSDEEYADRFELRLKSIDGEVFYFLINSWSLRPGLIKGQGQNITDLKMANNRVEDTVASLKSVIENTDDYVFIATCSGELIAFNQNFSNVLSDFYNISIREGANILELIPEVLYKDWAPLLAIACQGQRQIKELDVFLNEWYHVEISVNPILKNNTVTSVSFFIRDITVKWRLGKLDTLVSAVFEKAFKSRSLKDVVDKLLTGIESLAPGMKCYVTRKRNDVLTLEWLSAPSLPPSYTAHLKEIPIDFLNGSCGLAAASMEPVYISDIREHECWDLYREITLLNGFQACYSFPVISNDGVVLGTLGAYFTEVHEMSDYEISLMERAVNVVGILMEKDNMITEIQQRSNQLKEISASIPGVIYIVSMDNFGNRRFVYVSDGVEKYLNLSKEKAMESYGNILSSVHPEDKEKFIQSLESSIKHKSVMEIEFRLSPEVRPEFHCYFLKAVHSFKTDGTIMTYGSVIDISERKKAETIILQKQMEMEALINCIDDFVFVVDKADLFIDAYCKDESTLLADRNNFIGKGVGDVLPEDVFSSYNRAKGQLETTGQPVSFYYEAEMQGRINYYKARLIKVTASDNMLISVKNITEEKHLHADNEKLIRILDEAGTYAAFGSFEFNMEKGTLILSYHFNDLLGLTVDLKEKELFKFYFSAIHPDDRAHFGNRIENALQNGNGFECEYRMRHGAGEYIWLKCIVKVNTDPLTEDKVLQGIAIDITDSKTAEMEGLKKKSLLQAISILSLKLVSNEELDQSIQLLMNTMGKSFEVNRIYLFKNKKRENSDIVLTTQLLEWTDGTIPPQIDNEQLIDFNLVENGFERWVTLLSNGDPLMGHVKDFPLAEKEVLSQQDIKSILVVPVFVGGEWWGFLGFDECRMERLWSEDEVSLLNAVANLIGTSLEKYSLNLSIANNEKMYRSAFESLQEGLLIFDPSGKLVSCNDAACAILQMDVNEIAGLLENGFEAENGSMLLTDGSKVNPGCHPVSIAVKENKSMHPCTIGLQVEGQSVQWLQWSVSVVSGLKSNGTSGTVVSVSDVSFAIEKEQKLKSISRKWESICEGIQSRIKRDLAILSGQIRLEELFVNDERFSKWMKDGQSKLEAIALSQDTIYDKGSFNPSRFGEYIDRMCKAILSIHKVPGSTVSSQVACDANGLSEKEVTATGLIINELVINASCYAFKGRSYGAIKISFKTQGDYHVLEVRDNGIGFPEGFKFEKATTKGYKMVYDLVNLLNGAMTIESKEGATVIITFPKSKVS